MPTLLHGPGCNLGSDRGCPLVEHYGADLQSVHGLRCYGDITRTRNVSEYMLVLALCLVIVIIMQRLTRCVTARKTNRRHCEETSTTLRWSMVPFTHIRLYRPSWLSVETTVVSKIHVAAVRLQQQQQPQRLPVPLVDIVISVAHLPCDGVSSRV